MDFRSFFAQLSENKLEITNTRRIEELKYTYKYGLINDRGKMMFVFENREEV